MSLDSVALLGAVRDKALSLGVFEGVDLHEPKDAPGNGLTLAYWVLDGRPVPEMSGLAKTSWRIAISGRLYLNMLHEPQDDIDTQLMGALDALIASYSGEFTLGGLVEEVDLFGSYGDPLFWQLRYVTHNYKVYRVAEITVPLIITDLYQQGA